MKTSISVTEYGQQLRTVVCKLPWVLTEDLIMLLLKTKMQYTSDLWQQKYLKLKSSKINNNG